MMRALVAFACLDAGLAGSALRAEDLPPRWDDLTAQQWPEAIERSGQTVVLPFGVLEKHGMHAPIGSDIIKAREVALRAAKREYAVVFPDYIFGQIHEARHQPGTFAVSDHLALDNLDATCEEIARNGFTKIVIVKGGLTGQETLVARPPADLKDGDRVKVKAS